MKEKINIPDIGTKGDNRKTMTLQEWRATAVKLYGEDVKKWKFKCISCGHEQTEQDFIDAKIENPENLFFFSCIGRWVDGVGCDWTLGGLFRIHKLEVIAENGEKVPVFEFADELPIGN